MLARSVAYAIRERLDAGQAQRATPGAALDLLLNRSWRRLGSFQADKCAMPTPRTVHWSACATDQAAGRRVKARRRVAGQAVKSYEVLASGSPQQLEGALLTEPAVMAKKSLSVGGVALECFLLATANPCPAAPWREVRAALLPGLAQAVLNRSRRSRGITRTAEGWPGFSSCTKGKTNTHLTQLVGDLIFGECELIFHARRRRRDLGVVTRVCWGVWRAPGLI